MDREDSISSNKSFGSLNELSLETDSMNFATGQIVEADWRGAAPSFLILLSGKIRVLQNLPTEGQKTVLTLAEGDLWKPQDLAAKGLILMSSSDKTKIACVSNDLLESNAFLQERFQGTVSKIKALPNSSFAPAPEIMENEISTEGDYGLDNCLRKIIECSKNEKNISFAGLKAENIDHLREIAENLNFVLQERELSWGELLNADYPLIFYDESKYHWIVSRAGNTLLEEINDKQQRCIPQDLATTKKYKTFLLKENKKFKAKADASSLAEPYTFDWYWNFFTENWLLSSQMIFGSILVQLFALAMPVFYLVIFDYVFGRQNLATLDVLAFGMVILLTFDLVIKFLRSYILAYQLETIDRKSLDNFIERLFNVPLAKISRDITRSYNEAFNELVKTNQAIVSMILISSLDAFFSIFIVIALLFLNAPLALISISPIVLIWAYMSFMGPRMKKRALAAAQDQRQCQTQLNEVLAGMETVKSLNASRPLKQSTEEKVEKSLVKGFPARFDRVSEGTLLGAINGFGSLITLYYGAHKVLEGEITFGVYLAINMLSKVVIGSVQKLLSSITKFQEAIESSQQLRNLYHEQDEFVSSENGIYLNRVRGHIKISDLYFRYLPEAPWVLQSLNLEIKPRQKVVLTGKSGSGKTTLIRLLERLYSPNQGYICLDNYNLADMNLRNLRRHIGVALQKPAIFAGTIKENIALGDTSANLKEISEAASMAQLDQFLLQSPKGLDLEVMAGGANLSGGQAARIALARVFLMNPSLLVFDEATSSLDRALRASIYSQAWTKYRDSTCIFVTDYIPVHQKADLIIVLHEGQIVEQGTYAELISLKGYYYNLFPIPLQRDK